MSGDEYDPSDDQDAPAEIDSIDDTEPVDTTEDATGSIGYPPAEWGQDLTDTDWDERLEGVEISDDPEDGASEDAG